MKMNSTYRHWHLETDADQIVWLIFDKKDTSVNTLDKEVMEELSTLLDQISQEKQYKGVILTSAKKSGFIAGADISQFTQFKDITHATQILLLGQQILSKFEALSIPSVAM